MDVVLRTDGDPHQATTAARQKLRDLDPELPMSNINTMDEWISQSAARPRLNSVLLEIFSGIAMLIAAIGIYGVLSYSVSRQTQEIGVRVALGARRGHVLRVVMQEGMTMVFAGIFVGLAAAFGVSRLMASLLFGVEARDPLTFGSVAAILTAVAIAACWIPALRASRLDPVIALRGE
jgi:putative ABC transport system permease protein